METTKPNNWLRCAVCGRSVKFSPAELLEFTKSSWPECCGEVMVLSDSTVETPALQVGESA